MRDISNSKGKIFRHFKGDLYLVEDFVKHSETQETMVLYRVPAEPPGKPKNTGVPIPSSGDLPSPGIEPGSPALQVDSLPTELSGKPQ